MNTRISWYDRIILRRVTGRTKNMDRAQLHTARFTVPGSGLECMIMLINMVEDNPEAETSPRMLFIQHRASQRREIEPAVRLNR